MNNTTTTPRFSDFTRYDHLSIAEACLASERDQRNARRAARAAGATYGTWSITER